VHPGPAAGAGREEDPAAEPGVRDSIDGVREAVTRLLGAHMALLKAELAVAGRELGIIVGLALAAFVLAVLAGILLYVGSFLFFGELLFGSMGWGIIHGILIPVIVIGLIGVDLAGGQAGRFALGSLFGLGVGIVLVALLLSNVGNTAGEAVGDWANRTFVTEQLPFGQAWMVTLSGLVIGGAIVLLIGLVGGWRAGLRGGTLVGLGVASFLAGGLVGAIWTSTRYEAPDGVLGLAVTVGLVTWLVAGAILASRRGFDPEARYANLVPRESMSAFEGTKAFLLDQWERQKNRMMGR
jgi:hypothetical protein